MVFTSVAVPEKQFLYFQLKNPRVAAFTMLWMPNGGNHAPPWNGRVASAIGVEEIMGFFFYGIVPSIEKNLIQERGYKTFADFDAKRPTSVKLISGLVPIDKSFKGVKDIAVKNEREVTILGRGGEKMDVACRTGFLSDDSD
jgi:hypothetical protein